MIEHPISSCSDCPMHTNGSCAFVPRKVPAGTQLWAQGEVPREALFVKSGVLALTASDSAGQELGAAVRGPRSLLGLESLRGDPARASLQALTDTVVCGAAPATVRRSTGLQGAGFGAPEALAANAASLLQLTLDELARQEQDAALQRGTALSRVAHFILKGGPLIASGRQAPFSKRHVAALIGLRPETLSRCLRELESAGVITGGRKISVLDEARLREISEGKQE